MALMLSLTLIGFVLVQQCTTTRILAAWEASFFAISTAPDFDTRPNLFTLHLPPLSFSLAGGRSESYTFLRTPEEKALRTKTIFNLNVTCSIQSRAFCNTLLLKLVKKLI